MRRYFVKVDGIECEVSVSEYCAVERSVGFRPRLDVNDPAYLVTPAASGFYASGGISGRVED